MRDRILGSLVGLAVGDCLGAPAEGRHPKRIKARFGILRDFQYGGRPIWTDDTQQAVVLVESLVRNGCLDPAWIGRRFVEMRDSYPSRKFGLHRGTGGGFRDSVDAFDATGDWRSSGQLDRAGNGAAMRIAPVATALGSHDLIALAQAVVDVSRLTHRELRGLAGGLAVAWVASKMAAERSYPLPAGRGSTLLEELSRWVRDQETALEPGFHVAPPGSVHDVSDAIAAVAAVGLGWGEQEQAITDFASRRIGKPIHATAGYVLCSVVTSIAIVIRSNASFEETLVHAVNLGGDADTVGAMVGGMAGAAAGVSSIPDRWLSFPGYDELAAWGGALVDSIAAEAEQRDPDDLPSLMELEHRMTSEIEHGAG